MQLVTLGPVKIMFSSPELAGSKEPGVGKGWASEPCGQTMAHGSEQTSYMEHTCRHVLKPEVDVSAFLPRCSILYLLRQGFWTDIELDHLAKLAHQRAPRVHLSLLSPTLRNHSSMCSRLPLCKGSTTAHTHACTHTRTHAHMPVPSKALSRNGS